MLVMSFAANWRWSLLATTYWILAQHLHCVSPLADVCSQVTPSGSCGPSVIRYYYDGLMRECRTFHWGGCLGLPGQSSNIFETEEDCVATCNGTVVSESDDGGGEDITYPTPETLSPGALPITNPIPPDPTFPPFVPKSEDCLLPLDVGQPVPLFPPFPRYFFNSSSWQCEQYYLIGNGGNSNSFRSKEECLETCVDDSTTHPTPTTRILGVHITLPTPPYVFKPEHCFLPLNSGQPSADFHVDPHPLYFFNSSSMQCEQFLLLGPGGNFNNFHTKEDCLEKCGNLTAFFSGDTESVDLLSDDPPTTTPTTKMTSSSSSSFLTLPPLPPETSTREPGVSETAGADTAGSASPPLLIPLPSNEPSDTETNSSKTTEQPVSVAEDNRGAFLYAAIAVVMLVALVSLVAVVVVILMVYRHHVTMKNDTKFAGHPEQTRKSLPSTSTCSSSASV